MNEQTVSDEVLREIENRASERFGMTPEGPFNCAHYGNDSPDIAAICRELLAKRRGLEALQKLLDLKDQVPELAAEIRELLARREADRLAEIAKRVPSEEELRTIAAPAGGGE